MRIQRFPHPEVFRETILPALLEREAENNLPLGILSSLIAGEFQEKSHPYLAAVMDGDQVKLAVIRTPPFPAVLSYQEGPLPDQVLNLVVGDLWRTYGADLSGVTGNKVLAGDLAARWEDRAAVRAELKMAMRIYRLEAVRPVPDPGGRLKAVRPEDRGLLLEWYAGFHREALGEEPEPDRVQRGVSRFLEADPAQRGLVFWVVEGDPVSMAGYSGPTPHGIRVGAVYTPPALRRQGYATACVAALSSHLLNSGFEFCFLFTDLLNPTSNAIYQQIGYRPVTDVDTYHFS